MALLYRRLAQVVLLLAAFSTVASGFRVLFLVPFPGPSHWLMLKHFVRELTNRGHEVTCITAFEFGEPLANYTEVLIEPPYPLRETFESIYSMKHSSDFDKLFAYWEMGLKTSRHGLASANVQRFLQDTSQRFDLVIAEQFFQESWLMFAHKFNVPIVTISTYGYGDFMDRAMGLLTPWSFVPHTILDYGDNMNLLQRVYNVLLSSVDYVMRRHWYLPEQNKLANEYFAELSRERGGLVTVEELEKSISLMLVNSHPTLVRPRPTIRGLVDIAGVHIRQPRPLPAKLQQFMDDAPRGVIYFSLGAYMQSSLMPTEKRNAILRVFAKLPLKVIWKYEDDTIDGVPPNVMIVKWAPQNDILAHRNVKLFIAHGGQFGTYEAMYHGVPVLFIPFFADQHRNALRATREGFALQMRFDELTEETFGTAIHELTENLAYYERAKHIAGLFRDRLVDPMEESMFWIEYVVRNKGAKHLKSNAVNLSLAQYLLLDILGGATLISAILVLGLYACCCRRKTTRIASGNKKKKA